MPEVPILYDAPEAILIGMATLLAIAGTWALVDRRSEAAARLRQLWRLPAAGRLIVTVLATAALVMIVEDVVNRRQDELVLRLDEFAQQTGRLLASHRLVREAASAVSRLTGEGLMGAVAAAAAFLATAQRQRDAAVVLAGTFSAWVLSVVLKMAFGITRPSAHNTWYEFTGYGFPSAHVLVTLVGLGLLAWALGRDARPGTRIGLYVGAAVMAGLAGAARVILVAHWFSDVMAGFVVGTVWLNLAILAASWRGR